MMGRLREVCGMVGELTEADIAQLEALEQQLPLLAALTDADIFIDCFLNEDTALVAAHARPTLGESTYCGDVIGAQATEKFEPAVFRACATGLPVCDLKAITQESKAVRQNAAPIFNGAGRVIGVLIREKDVSMALRQARKYEAVTRTRETALQTMPQVDGAALMLREMHHRIKNSLQMVSSILELQARQSNDADLQVILEENVARILSISAIHDNVTRSRDLAEEIRGDALIEQLCGHLRMLISQNQDIRLFVEADPLWLSSDTATSVAQVVSELVTNALRHGFPEGSAGDVCVSLRSGNLFHTVTVVDNGVGLPANLQEGLGLQIVRSIVREKLRGRIHVGSDGGGTKISFDFCGEIS